MARGDFSEPRVSSGSAAAVEAIQLHRDVSKRQAKGRALELPSVQLFLMSERLLTLAEDVLDGEWRSFYWGQEYGGTLETI